MPARARSAPFPWPILLATAVCGAHAAPAAEPAPRPAAAQERPALPLGGRPWSDDILYFVLVDRFAQGGEQRNPKVDRTAKGAFHGGNLLGLIAQLDEIASLGVTALWINPLVKNIDGFVSGAGFPDWAYHGYWADDFTRLDPRFGTEEELRSLVDACHARGIKVLLDVVYNHAGYGSHYLSDPKTRGWLRSGEHGGCGDDDLTSCVAGLPDFETERPEVADFLLGAQLAWAKKSGVDGFRLDTVKHVDHPFWQEQRRRLDAQVGKGFFLLGEVWGGDAEVLDPWFVDGELDAGFDFGFAGSTVGFVQGRGRPVAFDRYLQSREKKLRPGHLLAHFLSSHDVPGALFQLKGDLALFRLAATIQLTSAGLPVIYYGEEVARAGGDWPENRSDMPWGERPILPGAGKPRDEALRAHYQKLIRSRKLHPALSRGQHQGLVTEGDLYVYARRLVGAEAVVVAVNRGDKPLPVRFPAPPEWGSAAPVDELGGAPVARREQVVELELAGRQAAILAMAH